jgi:hypothetical protein
MDTYSLRIIERYGVESLRYLAEEKRKVKQFTCRELEGMIEDFKLRLKNLSTV